MKTTHQWGSLSSEKKWSVIEIITETLQEDYPDIEKSTIAAVFDTAEPGVVIYCDEQGRVKDCSVVVSDAPAVAHLIVNSLDK